jgi:sulfur carrier protein ThiS adenylyltransferase
LPICPASTRVAWPAPTVLLGGAGNIGTHAAVFLARAGIGRLRIVDRDRVEAKNLTNQDYRPQDVGAWKADALAQRLREEFPQSRSNR